MNSTPASDKALDQQDLLEEAKRRYKCRVVFGGTGSTTNLDSQRSFLNRAPGLA